MALDVDFPVTASGPSLGINAHPVIDGLEVNSSTFLRGAVLIDSGSGTLQEAGANPADIVGVAILAGQNGTSKTTKFNPAIRGVVFEGQIDQDAGDLALLQTHLWGKYGITKEATSGYWYVDVDKTGANARVVVVGFKSAVGDTKARVYFVFLSNNTIFG